MRPDTDNPFSDNNSRHKERLISGYLIPAEPAQFELEVKKSRFIAYLSHTPGKAAAKAFVDEIRHRHADARHNCWAFVAGPPQDAMQLGFSDDGEPSGTAGKPILAQLQGSNVGEITAVVSRYFGGVKLGTGGLVKAYGGCVQQALAALVTLQKVPQQQLLISCDYSQQGTLEHLITQFAARVVQQTFDTGIQLTISIDGDRENAFTEQLINSTRGLVTIVKAD